MSSLIEMLSEHISGDTLGEMSRQLDADEDATAKAVSAALPILVGALARNASEPQGAQSLSNALAKEHDGSVLDQLGDLVRNPQAGSGDGILGHVLGGKRRSVESGLSRMSGLDPATVTRLLTMLAPLVMGTLGRTQRKRQLDPGGLAEMLKGERERVARQAPQEVNILEDLLDTDDDGQVIDDVVKLGGGLLQSYFRPRR